MTRKPNAKNLGKDVEKALEEALLSDMDFNIDPLDTFSLDEFTPPRESEKKQPPLASPRLEIDEITQPTFTPPVPANDVGNKDVSVMLRNLHQKLPTNIFRWTSLVSLIWCITLFFIARNFYATPAYSQLNLSGFLATPIGASLIAMTVFPTALFWAFALMIRRSDELHVAAQSMRDVALKLSEPEALAQDRVVSVGRAIRREVAAMSEGIERTLARASELETLVNGEVHELERAYGENETKIRSLVQDLSNEREAIINHAERVRTTITGSHEQLKEELSNSSFAIRDTVLDASTQLSLTLNEVAQSLIGRINENVNNVSQTISTRTDEIENKIITSGAAFASLLDTRVASLGQQAEQLSLSLSDTLENGSANISFVLSEATQNLANQLDQTSEGLNVQISQFSKTVQEQSDHLLTVVGATTQELSTEFETRFDHLNARMSEKGRELITELETRAHVIDASSEKINSAVDQRVRMLNDTLIERTKDLSQTLTHAHNNLLEQSEGLKTLFNDGVENYGSIVNNAHDLVSQTMTKQTQNLENVIQERTESLTQSIMEANTHISTTLDERADLINKNFMNQSQILRSTLDDGLDYLTQTFTVHRETISEQISQDLKQLTNTRSEIETLISSELNAIEIALSKQTGAIEERTETMRKALEIGVEAVRHSLENSASVMAATLRERVREAAGAITDEALRANTSLDGYSANYAGKLEAMSADFAEKLANKIAQIEERLIVRSNENTRAFIGQADEIIAALDGADQRIVSHVHQVSAELDARVGLSKTALTALNTAISEETLRTSQLLDGKTADFAHTLDTRSKEIIRILDETALPMLTNLADSGRVISTQIEGATKTATDKLRYENDAMVQNLTVNTGKTIEAISLVNADLTGNVNSLVEKLQYSNSQLGGLIQKAAENLGIIDQKLVTTTHNLAENTERAVGNISSSARILETNVSRLSGISSETLKEVASIAGRFDEHGRVLASASDLLNAAQSSMTSTLQDRQEALERLSINLVSRSEDIEKNLRSFENLVLAAFEKAETRAGTSTMAMKHSLAEVVEQATTRFAQATQDMRKIAHDIRFELDATKAEIKKGVADMPEDARKASQEIKAELELTRLEIRKGIQDLPKETKESTQTMRRAVAEQINALKELSEIVGKSGKAFDISSPVMSHNATPDSSFKRLLSASDLGEKTPEAPQKKIENNDSLPVSPVVNKLEHNIPLQEKEVENPPSSNSWISNLLQRASKDEKAISSVASTPSQRRSPLNVVESLNSLSADIARAIDHEASLDLWDRYRNGEKNVFTRRLYTLKGQQTFDAIRLKYQSDQEFRMSVDRYVDDFERLLQDVARNDKSNTMAQNYLALDTGKVYTMLAHASGRLK